MFDFMKKGVPVDLKNTIVRKMSGGVLDYEGQPVDDNGYPLHLYEFGLGADTEIGTSSNRLKKCPYTRNEIRADVKKMGKAVYYLSPNRFRMSFGLADGRRIAFDAKLRLESGYIGNGRSREFGIWLADNVRDPADNLDESAVARLLDGKYMADHLPEWLLILGDMTVSEIPEEPKTEKPREERIEDFAPGYLAMGQFRIVREVGGGGQGSAYLAINEKEQIEESKRVVLKVLRDCDVRSREQLAREAETLHTLRHDDIAPFVTLRAVGDVPVLVMGYIEGRPLSAYLAGRENCTLDEAEVRELLRPIARALDYAHCHEVCHLDVDPRNIIVRNVAGMGSRTCLIDFGIARRKHSDGSVTMSTTVSGKRPYMSPEHWRGEKPSATMDIYSLAVTAYECLMGKLPYPEGWKSDVQVDEIAPSTPFTRAVMRGLDWSPKNRPATCAQLIDPPLRVAGFETTKRDGKTGEKDPDEKTGGQGGGSGEGKMPPQPLTALKRTIEIYRMMLAQSANKVANADGGRAEWMRDRQARLRDLTVDLAGANEEELADFFRDIKSRMAAMKSTPDDFFVATDRLVELRAGLPKTGGVAWRVLKESIS